MGLGTAKWKLEGYRINNCQNPFPRSNWRKFGKLKIDMKVARVTYRGLFLWSEPEGQEHTSSSVWQCTRDRVVNLHNGEAHVVDLSIRRIESDSEICASSVCDVADGRIR